MKIVVDNQFAKDSTDVLCTDFCFNRINQEIHLQLYYQCGGPHLLFYGISLSKLIPYIHYYGFKNDLKLYGKDITSLIGTNYNELGNKIIFDDDSIHYSKGYFMEKDTSYPHLTFGISKWFSKHSLFFIFMKQDDRGQIRQSIITDVLEIKNEYIKGKIFRYGTYDGFFNSSNPEIFATMKVRITTLSNLKKIKEWKGNRRTGKFEVVEYQ